jgi:hypothetical protein
MFRRIAAVGLLVLLLPGLQGAPVPEKYPRIYALLYVGIGKNSSNIRKRVDNAINDVLNYQHITLPLQTDGKPMVGFRPKEIGPGLRASRVEDLAVVRVWHTNKEPEKQVEYINIYLEYLRHRMLEHRDKGNEHRGKAAASAPAERARWMKKAQEEYDLMEDVPKLLEKAAMGQ